jgi:adenylate cyclase
VDIAMLMVTIWSFHLQYQEPAGIYLKAPTLMYAFILIALRTLRFEARYVILAGVASAAGWLALVAYAVATGEMVVTRNYAEYMTSYRILLGAEFDKIVSLAMVTAILAVAIVRARRLMVSAYAEEQAASALSRFFAPEVASQIRMAETGIEPGTGVIREAAVLMTDLRGFTALSHRLTPNETIALLSEVQARLVPIIQKHGGSIDKYLGDGIMATFGATRTSQTFAADALRAIDEIMAGADKWRRERKRADEPVIRLGAAVAVGPLLFGAVGHDARLEYTVIGEVVNLAAKLEKHTKREGVQALATAEAAGYAEVQGYRPGLAKEVRRGRRVEGVDMPLDLVVLA